MSPTRLVWFRNDLRANDNPALHAACRSEGRVLGLFIATPGQWRQHALSQRRIALTLEALRALRWRLARRGIPLLIRECPGFAEVPALIDDLIAEWGVTELALNREYAWDEQQRDRTVAEVCRQRGVAWRASDGSVIVPPGCLATRQGDPYRVFTPFKRAWLAALPRWDRPPLPPPAARAPALEFEEPRISAPPPAATFADIARWPTHEKPASEALDRFLLERVDAYHLARDLPAVEGTSRLSPCLTVGTLSARQCLHRLRLLSQGALMEGKPGPDSWLTELIWREFYLHVLAAFPRVSKGLGFRPATDTLPWRHAPAEFAAWCEGRTGYPLVDAAMRQLVTTGWMHNRLRMVTATFLSKYLLIDWRLGERFFMEQLADGHFAANNGGWQWSASTGTDAAPYFRLLSPVRQAQRFDPEATFIRRFVPELAALPARLLHQPGHPALLACGYPPPIVDLAAGRERCLAAFKAL